MNSFIDGGQEAYAYKSDIEVVMVAGRKLTLQSRPLDAPLKCYNASYV
ncbi:hypothetical protein [Gluconobacter sp. P5B12]|nr:hypothetical protein [Gluconobacter sp. P5B12]